VFVSRHVYTIRGYRQRSVKAASKVWAGFLVPKCTPLGRYASAQPVEVYRDGRFAGIFPSQREAKRFIAAQRGAEVR
jgi:hypothetical protein